MPDGDLSCSSRSFQSGRAGARASIPRADRATGDGGQGTGADLPESYRLDRAAKAIERWRALAPEDPEPCLWSNEIASRTDADSAVLIQNYRAALERDPNLDQARLGLAQQLSKDRRFEEAEQEFRGYLKRNPKSTAAFLGLGRNAFQQGNIEGASEFFESALETNPRDPETLKELGQIDLRLGRIQQACERLKLLSQIEPFDHEVRYSYAQALKLAGDPEPIAD